MIHTCITNQQMRIYKYAQSRVVEFSFIPPCIPDSHPHRVTNTKCHIDTVVSPDDGHIVARNMQRKEINILRKIVQQVGFIYKITHVVMLQQHVSVTAVTIIRVSWDISTVRIQIIVQDCTIQPLTIAFDILKRTSHI